MCCSSLKFNKTSEDLIVKEQRVDGSWLLKNNLRYTLMDCESSYQVKIPSKQNNKESDFNFIIIKLQLIYNKFIT
jgi:hypothetical protein